MTAVELAEIADPVLVGDRLDMQQVEDAHMVVAHMVMQAVYAALHGRHILQHPQPDGDGRIT